MDLVRENPGALETACISFWDAFTQPVTGIRQLLGNEVKQNKAKSQHSFAEGVGAAFGGAALFLTCVKLAGKVPAMSSSAEFTTGAALGFLTPLDSEHNNWTTRLANTGIGAGTVGLLKYGGSVAAPIRSELARVALVNGAVGLLNTQAESLVYRHQLAGLSESLTGTLSWAGMGSGLHLAGSAFGRVLNAGEITKAVPAETTNRSAFERAASGMVPEEQFQVQERGGIPRFGAPKKGLLYFEIEEQVGQLRPEVADQFFGHGINRYVATNQQMLTPTQQLENLLANGIAKNKLFYEGVLRGDPVMDSMAEVAHKDTRLLLLGPIGQLMKERGIKYVIVDTDWYPKLIADMQERFPHVQFIPARNAAEALDNIYHDAVRNGFEPKVYQPAAPMSAEERAALEKLLIEERAQRAAQAQHVAERLGFAPRQGEGVLADRYFEDQVLNRFGKIESIDDRVVQLLHENPQLRSELEEAILQRFLLGEPWFGLDNFKVIENGSRLHIENLNIWNAAYGFGPDLQMMIRLDNLANFGLAREFANKPIAEPLLAKLADLIKRDNSVYRGELAQVVPENVVADIFARAQQLLEQRHFPQLPENMRNDSMAREYNRMRQSDLDNTNKGSQADNDFW